MKTWRLSLTSMFEVIGWAFAGVAAFAGIAFLAWMAYKQ